VLFTGFHQGGSDRVPLDRRFVLRVCARARGDGWGATARQNLPSEAAPERGRTRHAVCSATGCGWPARVTKGANRPARLGRFPSGGPTALSGGHVTGRRRAPTAQRACGAEHRAVCWHRTTRPPNKDGLARSDHRRRPIRKPTPTERTVTAAAETKHCAGPPRPGNTGRGPGPRPMNPAQTAGTSDSLRGCTPGGGAGIGRLRTCGVRYGPSRDPEIRSHPVPDKRSTGGQPRYSRASWWGSLGDSVQHDRLPGARQAIASCTANKPMGAAVRTARADRTSNSPARTLRRGAGTRCSSLASGWAGASPLIRRSHRSALHLSGANGLYHSGFPGNLDPQASGPGLPRTLRRSCTMFNIARALFAYYILKTSSKAKGGATSSNRETLLDRMGWRGTAY